MFSTVSSTLRAASVGVMLMMITVPVEMAATENANYSLRANNKSVSAAMVPLQVDNQSLLLDRTIRTFENCSISPWSYNASKDDNLFPQLREAQCLLQGCLNSEGVEDRSLKSTPIIQQFLVLRRVRNNTGHSYYFKLESRLMAVGCTCVRPIVQHQQ